MFVWTYLDGSDQDVGRSPGFPDAAEAEEWLGSTWQELFERGVEAVVLHDDRGRKLYRMSLGAEEPA